MFAFTVQRQRLISTKTWDNGDSDVPVRGRNSWSLENGLSSGTRGFSHCNDQEVGNETENDDNDGEEETSGDGPFIPFQCPGTEHIQKSNTSF